MLAYHCPDCGLPLFEREGRVFCVSCRKEVIFEKAEKEKIPEKGEDETEKGEDLKEIRIPEKNESHLLLVESIEKAAMKICEMISASSNAEDVKNLTDSLEKIVKMLEKIRNH